MWGTWCASFAPGKGCRLTDGCVSGGRGMDEKHDSGLPRPGLLEPELPEPWLRGTLTDVDAVRRQVLHALELACEDVTRWCAFLSDEEINARPFGLAPVAFHLRHIARSLDRLLTYAEGVQLSGDQIAALKSEMDEGATREALFAEFNEAIELSAKRVRALAEVDP